MFASLQDACLNGYPVIDTEFVLNELTPETYHRILNDGSRVKIANFEQRYQNLIQMHQLLDDQYFGQVANLFEAGNWDFYNINQRLTHQLPCLQDFHLYKGQISAPYRADKATQEVLYMLMEQASATFTGIERGTVSTDYRIPQLLQKQGLITLTDKFITSLEAGHTFSPNSEEAAQIRGASVLVGRQIANNNTTEKRTIFPAFVSNTFWTKTGSGNFQESPHIRIDTLHV